MAFCESGSLTSLNTKFIDTLMLGFADSKIKRNTCLLFNPHRLQFFFFVCFCFHYRGPNQDKHQATKYSGTNITAFPSEVQVSSHSPLFPFIMLPP